MPDARHELLRQQAADEVREVVLDGLREQMPDDWDSDQGVDEYGMHYEAMVDAVTKVFAIEKRGYWGLHPVGRRCDRRKVGDWIIAIVHLWRTAEQVGEDG